MEKRAVIAVLGSINVDISAQCDRFPLDGETVGGNTVRIGMGGKGVNQATAAARCGADVVMIGSYGNDFFSGIPKAHFAAEAIDARFVSENTECATGCALIEVLSSTGENRITVIPGANHRITGEQLAAAEDDIARADVLLTQMETNADAIEAFLSLARKHGKPVILNPAPALPIRDDLFPLIDTITPNETEAYTYTGVSVTDRESARHAADVFREKGVKRVIITCGKRGVFCADYTGEQPFFAGVPTNRVRAVDTTGAGDAFNGAFCTAVGEGRTAVDACRFACCAATLSVTKAGAADAMPHRWEIDAVYNAFYHSGKKITLPARSLADRHDLFWRALEGSGANGLITEADVRAALVKKA